MPEITTSVTDNQIKSMLCSAFEGGSNYWYCVDGYKLADGMTWDDFREGGKMQDPQEYWHPFQLIPLVEGCSLTISEDEDGTVHILDRAAIEKGLEIMARCYAMHFADVIADNDDAVTGDVFLQCCLFGKVVFG